MSATTTTVSTTTVALTASSSFVDPIAYWGDVLELAGTNLSAQFDAAIADPFPVLSQVVENQMGYANLVGTSIATTGERVNAFVNGAYFAGQIEKLKTELAAGNVASAARAINGILINGALPFYPLLDMTKIPGLIGRNFANVLQTLAMESLSNVGIVGRLGFGALELVRNALSAVAWTAQTIITAAQSGDAVALASAIVNAPASLIDGLLNGAMVPHPLPNRPPYRGGTGFLTPNKSGAGAASWTPLDAMIYIPRVIAKAITPPTTTVAVTATTEAPLAMLATSAPDSPAAANVASDSAPVEPQAAAPTEDSTAAEVSSQRASDLSDGNKAESGKTGTTSSRPGQRLKASLQNTAEQVDKGIKKLGSNIEKSVKKVSDRISTAGKKKAGATSAASSKNDNAGSSADSGSDD
ncbi:hypothetical protein [Mycolicibacterium fortuitum]|nr:hypothetical protein [Mycolicibacterium fortuitum]